MDKRDLQYDLQLDDEITSKIRALKNLGDLRIETDVTSDGSYFVQWSHFDDPWDSNEAYSDTPAGAVEDVYQQLWYILMRECESITNP